MTNYEKWRFYMQDFSSPDQFIDWGFYAMFSAALQRRVHLASEEKPLYANTFVVLVGPPAAGKGMVLGELARAFKDKRMLKNATLDSQREQLTEELGEDLMKFASTKKSLDRIKNMLIPLAPNATTYEALCKTLGDCARAMRIPTGEVDIETGKAKMKAVQHSSILFVLEELGSLIRKHHEDIHTFLQETYDCKEDYEYKTKNQGTDYIRKPCVSLIAGTTPEFLRRIFAMQILNEGFSSRAMYVVGMEPRRRVYDTPTFTKEQLAARSDVIEHLGKVAILQGRVKWSKEAHEFNRHWYEKEYAQTVPNPHPKLQPYYGRINIHHAKMAMAIHYSESLEPEISLETAQKTLLFLQKTELLMHLAINIESTNPLAKVTEEIFHYIKSKGSATARELRIVFYESLPDPEADIAKITTYLIEAGKIEKHESQANTYILRKKSE